MLHGLYQEVGRATALLQIAAPSCAARALRSPSSTTLRPRLR